MSLRIPPGFAESWMAFDIAGDPDPMFTALGVRLAVGVTADQATTDAILGAWDSPLQAFCTTAYNIRPSHVLFGQDGDDLRIDSTLATIQGTNGASAVPNNTASLITKGTPLGGRRGRGRMFVPGLDEADVLDNGFISGSVLTTLKTNAAAILTALVALAEVDAVALFHRSAPFTPTDVLSLDVSPRVATQRRRMRR